MQKFHLSDILINLAKHPLATQIFSAQKMSTKQDFLKFLKYSNAAQIQNQKNLELFVFSELELLKL